MRTAATSEARFSTQCTFFYQKLGASGYVEGQAWSGYYGAARTPQLDAKQTYHEALIQMTKRVSP